MKKFKNKKKDTSFFEKIVDQCNLLIIMKCICYFLALPAKANRNERRSKIILKTKELVEERLLQHPQFGLECRFELEAT